MKKLVTLLLLTFSVFNTYAQSEDEEPEIPQDFPTIRRAMLMELGVYTCEPCLTWAKPMMDYFKDAYGDSLIITRSEWGMANPYRLNNNVVSYPYFGYYMSTPFSMSWGTPSLWLNQNYRQTLSDDAVYKSLMHTSIDSSLALPAIASPVYTTQRIGTDSLVVNTYTKFLQNTTGDYEVTVLFIEDSIYYMQNGAATGWMYHMNIIKGPNWEWGPNNMPVFNGMDSLSYKLAVGNVAAGTIVSKQFCFKLDTMQHMEHIRPLVLITNFDTAYQIYDYDVPGYITVPRHVYVNANEKEYSASVPVDTTIPNPSSIAGTNRTAYEASIYPNPATNGVARVHLKGLNDRVQLQIFDALGKLVINQAVADGEELPLQALAPATYIYHFTVAGKRVMQGSLVVGR